MRTDFLRSQTTNPCAGSKRVKRNSGGKNPAAKKERRGRAPLRWEIPFKQGKGLVWFTRQCAALKESDAHCCK